MIASAALAAWLADRNSQKRSRAAVEDFADRWSREPLMAQLERRLFELPERTPDAMIEAARSFMDRAGDIDVLMGELFAASRRDPFFRPPFHPMTGEIHTALLLFYNSDLSIALGITGIDMLAAKKSGPRGATSIGFTGTTSLYRYLKAGDATIAFWETAPITENFVASQAGKCRLVDRRRLRDGDEFVIDGRYQSFIIEHASSDMLYFQAVVRSGAAPVVAEYDSKTLTFIGASSTDEASSRVQMMVSLLRTMDRADALPLLEDSLGSPQFYTRWHIMREMLAMDAEAALPALKRMAANDAHPEVRSAAQHTLELFFEEPDAAGEGDNTCRA